MSTSSFMVSTFPSGARHAYPCLAGIGWGQLSERIQRAPET